MTHPQNPVFAIPEPAMNGTRTWRAGLAAVPAFWFLLLGPLAILSPVQGEETEDRVGGAVLTALGLLLVVSIVRTFRAARRAAVAVSDAIRDGRMVHARLVHDSGLPILGRRRLRLFLTGGRTVTISLVASHRGLNTAALTPPAPEEGVLVVPRHGRHLAYIAREDIHQIVWTARRVHRLRLPFVPAAWPVDEPAGVEGMLSAQPGTGTPGQAR